MRTPSTARTVRKMRRLTLPFSLHTWNSTRAKHLFSPFFCQHTHDDDCWIHQAGAVDFDGRTDLAKAFRENLKASATIQSPRILRDHIAADGTRKWLIDVGGGDAIETVFIPEKTHGTLCISSQAG